MTEKIFSGRRGRSAMHFPSMQRVADVTEPIEDLSDIPDADIARMKAIRDAARSEKRTDKFGGIMAERTVLLDATEAVIGAHLDLFANETVAVRIGGRLPPGK